MSAKNVDVGIWKFIVVCFEELCVLCRSHYLRTAGARMGKIKSYRILVRQNFFGLLTWEAGKKI